MNLGASLRAGLRTSRALRLVLHLHALRLRFSPDGHAVSGLEAATRDGRRFDLRARAFVVAAGGIETARLLLLSAGAAGSPANPHGNVGRYFMEHGYDATQTYLPADARPAPGFYDAVRLTRGGQRVEARGAFAPTADTLRREGLLNCAISLRPAHEADAAFADPRVRAALACWEMLRSRSVPDFPWRTASRALTAPRLLARALWKRAFGRPANDAPRPLLCLFETAPDPENRVVLADTCDALGRRVARLHWKLHEFERRSVSRACELLDADLRAAGAGGLASRRDAYRPPGSYKGSVGEHHLGTTRMHSNPKQGVVDGNARVHGLDNLFVAGGSVFTTAGFANPTLTIVALAARLAAHLGSNAGIWAQPIQARASRQ